MESSSDSAAEATFSNAARGRRKQAKPRRKKVDVEEVSSQELVIDEEAGEETDSSTEPDSPPMSPSTRPAEEGSNGPPVQSPQSDSRTDQTDSVAANHETLETGLLTPKEGRLVRSESGSLQSSPFSDSITLLAGQGGLPFSCEQCGLSFAQREELEKHELSHPTPNQSCKICFKQFANVYRLQRHMISHDESAGLRKFKCPDCEKAFKFKHHLKEHVRIHSGEKPFECTNCGKRFSHSGSYSSHMTSKKCLIMNLKLGRGRNLETKPSPTAGHRGSNTKSRNSFPDSPTFPSVHPLLSAKLAKGITDNNMSPVSKDMSSPYASPSPPFLPPGSVNFHPFFMTAAAAAAAASNPYSLNMTNFFNSLPVNSPLRHLTGGLDEKKVNGKGGISPCSPGEKVWHDESSNERDRSINDDCKMKEAVIDDPDSPHDPVDREGDSDSGSVDNKVQRLLETVNANVTRQFLQACHMKNGFASDSPSSSPRSPRRNGSPMLIDGKGDEKSEIHHNNNNNINFDELEERRKERKRKKNGIEGLAARLELEAEKEKALLLIKEEAEAAAAAAANANGVITNGRPEEDLHSSQSENEYGEHNESQETQEEGRRARVRSLFSESQLAVLRHHYSMDPRPRREHLLGLAQQLVLPLRVVQVWFQNSRARDRREGRPPLTNTSLSSFGKNGGNGVGFSQLYNGFTPSRSIAPLSNWGINSAVVGAVTVKPEKKAIGSGHSEQPLDLSTKKSTPSNSPRPSTVTSEPMTSDSEDAGFGQMNGNQPLNLNKSMKNEYSTPTLLRLVKEEPAYKKRKSASPTTGLNNSRLAKILSQPPASPQTSFFHRLPGSNENSAHDARTPSPAVSLGPIIPPMLSSLIPVPSTSPQFSLNGFSHSPLSLMGGSSGVSGENGSIFPEYSSPGKKRKGSNKGLQSANNNNNGGSVNGLQPDELGQFSCDQCEKTFNKQSSLARHKYEHSGQRPYKCNTCEKAFKHKHHLTEHLRLHTGAKPFQCPKCGKRFSHSGSYSQHMNHRYAYCKPNPNNRN